MMHRFTLGEYEGIRVVRDDLIPGGTKARFLPELIGDAREVVYASPFCGGAAVALSTLAGPYRRITIFYAKRKELTYYQRQAVKNHARIIQIPYGYMSNVSKKARDYAAMNNALFLSLGFDTEKPREILTGHIEGLRKDIGSPDYIYCATGSGMLAKCIATAFPDSGIMAVIVGRESQHEAGGYPGNVTLLNCTYRFEQPSRYACPFPSHPHYDRKAWEILKAQKPKTSKTLFWNVMG